MDDAIGNIWANVWLPGCVRWRRWTETMLLYWFVPFNTKTMAIAIRQARDDELEAADTTVG